MSLHNVVSLKKRRNLCGSKKPCSSGCSHDHNEHSQKTTVARDSCCSWLWLILLVVFFAIGEIADAVYSIYVALTIDSDASVDYSALMMIGGIVLGFASAIQEGAVVIQHARAYFRDPSLFRFHLRALGSFKGIVAFIVVLIGFVLRGGLSYVSTTELFENTPVTLMLTIAWLTAISRAVGSFFVHGEHTFNYMALSPEEWARLENSKSTKAGCGSQCGAASTEEPSAFWKGFTWFCYASTFFNHTVEYIFALGTIALFVEMSAEASTASLAFKSAAVLCVCLMGMQDAFVEGEHVRTFLKPFAKFRTLPILWILAFSVFIFLGATGHVLAAWAGWCEILFDYVGLSEGWTHVIAGFLTLIDVIPCICLHGTCSFEIIYDKFFSKDEPVDVQL